MSREYAVGLLGTGFLETYGEPTTSVEEARATLARTLILFSNRTDDSDARRFSNIQLITRDDTDPEWRPVEDAAQHTLQAVFARMSVEFHRIGTGVIQGYDLSRLFNRLSRDLGATSNPEEFDS